MRVPAGFTLVKWYEVRLIARKDPGIGDSSLTTNGNHCGYFRVKLNAQKHARVVVKNARRRVITADFTFTYKVIPRWVACPPGKKYRQGWVFPERWDKRSKNLAERDAIQREIGEILFSDRLSKCDD